MGTSGRGSRSGIGQKTHSGTVLGAADQHVVITGRDFRRARPLAASPEIDFDKMSPARQQLRALGQVVIPVRSGRFVRGAKQFNGRDDPTIAPVANLQAGVPFHVYGRHGQDFNLNQVVASHQGGERVRTMRNEPLVEILPRVILLQVGIHPRKWRSHERSPARGHGNQPVLPKPPFAF
jgi:hypothetical protein